MAKYGNILTIYNSQGNQLDTVKDILTRNDATFEQVDTTFFLESKSLPKTRAIQDELQSVGLEFSFFHNRNSDGSTFRSSFNQSRHDRIRKIMLE